MDTQPTQELSERTPLQKLVAARLEELGLSYRSAAAKSQGLISHSVFSRLLDDERWAGKVHAKTIAGLALALDLPEAKIKKAADETLRAEEFAQHERLFRGLSPANQSKIIKLMQDLDAAQRKAARERLRAERPYVKR